VFNKLPILSDPVKYSGLYIFDFGDHVAVGYTAEEIEFLLADSRYAGGNVYKICHARADGTLEIRGANPLSWNLMTGMVFWFDDLTSAVNALKTLQALAAKIGPPGNFDLLVIHHPDENYPYSLIMRYISELEDILSAWLLKIEFNCGKSVESGANLISDLLANSTEMLREQIGAVPFRRSRSRQEVLDTVNLSVQR